MTNVHFPPVSAALVASLEHHFPDNLPTTPVEERQLYINVGEANVVKFLRRKHVEQSKDPFFDD